MAKGTFEKEIMIDVNEIKIRDTRNDRVITFKNGFAVVLPTELFENQGYIAVRYFGKRIGSRFFVNSFSYNVVHLPKHLQKKYSHDKFWVAKAGLELVGVAF